MKILTLTVPPLPVVIVPAAFSVSPPDVAAIPEFIWMLRTALSVSVLDDDQLSASLTKISPLPAVAPSSLEIETLPELRLADSVAPVMSPPEAATVKSFGSISH